jgi:hypothetical protein
MPAGGCQRLPDGLIDIDHMAPGNSISHAHLDELWERVPRFDSPGMRSRSPRTPNQALQPTVAVPVAAQLRPSASLDAWNLGLKIAADLTGEELVDLSVSRHSGCLAGDGARCTE